jgi:diguanylate cyclase (GGDEF)-like protein
MLDMLDIPTLRQCSMLASLSYACAFVVMAQGRREPWMYWWGAASAIYGGVLLGYGVGGDPLPVVLWPPLNGLLVFSSAMVVAGVRMFDGRRPFAPWIWAMVAGVAIIPAVILLVGGVKAAHITLSGGLALAMAVFGWPLLVSDARDGTRIARRITGATLVAYIPGYLLAMFADFLSARTVVYIQLFPMIADQLLLGVANLSLLAIPGTRSQHLLREAAMRDALTGAWNRAALAAREADLRRPGGIVLLVDVDQFKTINDQHGHATGDRVLAAIAGALHGCVTGGFVARLGGDEFVVVAQAGDPAIVADRVRRHASGGGGDLPRWTVSVGAAVIAHGDRALADTLQRADALMYRAKDAGRGRIAA